MIASLAVLFLTSIVAAWWLDDDPRFWPDGPPPLPFGIWPATALLGLLSWTIERAARVAATDRAVKYGMPPAAAGAARGAFVLAIGFLVLQGWNWAGMLAELPANSRSLYAFHFYALTVLHALHVVGGLIWHGLALRRPSTERLRNVALYWHFLGAVWLLLLANLLLLRVDHEFGSLLSLVSLSALGALTLMSGSCWWRAVRLLAARGEIGMAVLSVLFPPFAFVHVWARAEELGTERFVARWGAIHVSWMVALIFAGAVHAAWMRSLAS